SDRTDLAGAPQPFDRGQDVFEARDSIERGIQMHDLDPLDAETGERAFDGTDQVHRIEPGVVGMSADSHCQKGAVPAVARTQPLPDDVLAASAGVTVCGVDRVAADLEVPVQDRVAGL